MCNLRLPDGSDCPSKADGDCMNDTCGKDASDKYVCCSSGEYRLSTSGMVCNLRLPDGSDCPSHADGDCANG